MLLEYIKNDLRTSAVQKVFQGFILNLIKREGEENKREDSEWEGKGRLNRKDGRGREKRGNEREGESTGGQRRRVGKEWGLSSQCLKWINACENKASRKL